MRVTAIFDIGKTNKKFLLFDEAYRLVYEFAEQLPETTDDDGFPCEDIQLLKKWIEEKWNALLSQKDFFVTSVNFTSYGASLVHLDENNSPVTPLYSYLKPYPVELSEKLYEQYEGKWNFSAATCSPPMGMLNSGLQLYWLKNEKPKLFEQIAASLHLPQYLSFLFSKKKISDYTSIGCHTALWDFGKRNYHQWVVNEGMNKLLVPPTLMFPQSLSDFSSEDFAALKPQSPLRETLRGPEVGDNEIIVGSGLHDSSSALIPYLKKFKGPFLLISTGTWCITLNPFNHSSLTKEELSKDCLCYLTTDGNPVKASRIFLGREHEFQIERIAKHFGKDINFYSKIKFNPNNLKSLIENNIQERQFIPQCMEGTGPFPGKAQRVWDLNLFSSYEEAYLQLMLDLTCMLKYSLQLVDSKSTETIFAEGGFGANDLFMNLLANHFPNKKVKASFLQQATALGAALHINTKSELENWDFKGYSSSDIHSLLENYYKDFTKRKLSE